MPVDLTTKESRLAIAGKYATKYNVDVALVCAVIEQESSWTPNAVRYEPAFYERYIVPLGLTNQTEAMCRSMSFGLMQLMGQVARELGFPNKFLTDLCDPDTGIEYGCKHLTNKLNQHGGDVAAALQAWNGGGNPQYSSQVMARIPSYEQAA